MKEYSGSEPDNPIVRLLDDQPLAALRPVLEDLLEHQTKMGHQRALAELLAGVLQGAFKHDIWWKKTKSVKASKFWPTRAQDALWDWFKPRMKLLLYQNIRPDTLDIWISFLQVSGILRLQ